MSQPSERKILVVDDEPKVRQFLTRGEQRS